jgi:RNA polymerase sigma-32 factor
VQENDVVEMNRRLGGDVSLNTLVQADEAGEVQDLLVDPASSPEAVYAEQQEAKQRRQALADALEALNPRERCIFEARFLSEPSVRLGDLAIRYGVSHERVRQIENRAFEKVRAAVCALREPSTMTPGAESTYRREAKALSTQGRDVTRH